METLDALRALKVVLAEPDAQRSGALCARLQQLKFPALESLGGMAELTERLQRAVRYRERELGLVLVAAGSWSRAGQAQRARVLGLAAECDAVLGLISAAGGSERAVAAARAGGFALSLSGSEAPQQLLQLLGLALDVRQERRLRREREQHLEGQLSEGRVMEARLHFIAYHDELTGLFNRRRLRQALDLALLRGAEFGHPCSLLLIDLDRFKLVNDLEGHEVGDQVLVELSRLLCRAAGEDDVVARIGSDEFVLLLERCGPEAALQRAESLRRQLEEYRFTSPQRQYRTCVSIGVASAEAQAGVDAGEMLARADQACYIAKQNGRNRIHQYRGSDPQLVHLRSDFSWAPRIREALEGGRLFFHYQPVVRLRDGTISHYEMLLRLRDREGRVHGPGEFIPAAERTGLIHEIDLWVVDQAVDFLAELPAEQHDLSVTVNLSAHAFNNRRLLDLLSRKLELSWVSPTRLVFEITETAAISNLEQGRELVARLRALGCRFALDDFGAGFSTFHYLKQFPVDYLKLDGSFIVNLRRDAVDQALVQHMISVGHSLGKEIVAEFVEDAPTLNLLRDMGVDYVQGHYLGRAAPRLLRPEELPPEVRHNPGQELGLFDESAFLEAEEAGPAQRLRVVAGGEREGDE